jgi:hypothetical protein
VNTAQNESLALTVESLAGEAESRRMAVNLIQNLNSTGSIRATNARAQKEQTADYEELKSDGLLMQTIMLTFVKAGAATTLIKSLAAMFKNSRDKELKATIKTKGRSFSITARELGSSDFESLVRMLESEARRG